MQLIGMLQNAQNPMMMIQQMFGNNPQYRQVMQAIQGKALNNLNNTQEILQKIKGLI